MKEDSTVESNSNDSSITCGTTSNNQEFLKRYLFGRRVPRKETSCYYKRNEDSSKTNQNLSSKIILNLSESCDVAMPSKKEGKAEGSQSQETMKSTCDGENETMKNNIKLKAEVSESSILRSVLKPQGVPVPPDKVGIVREPQVIVRKFNIPMLCPANSTKFTKLKERWKYQHDVVGLTNVNPTNPLHAIMKSKPVVAYSVASFVNDGPSPKSSNTNTLPGAKISTNAVLPKNIVNASWLPSSSSSSNITVLPSGLPSTPTAMVKSVQVLPSQSSTTNSIENGKMVILKAGQSTFNVEGDKEPESSITSPSKIPKSNTFKIQGTEKDKEPQNGKIYLNPYADVKESAECLVELCTDQVTSAKNVEVDTNTLHLEILSEGSSRTIKVPMTNTGDVEMSDLSSLSIPFNQGENKMKTSTKVSDSEVIGQTRTYSFKHHDKPLTVIKVPASGNVAVSQVLLKSLPSAGNPVTVQTATPSPRLVASVSDPVQQSDGSIIKKTIQFTPLALTSPINGVQQKPVINDVPLSTSAILPQKSMNDVLILKSVQPQNVSSGKLTPLIMAGKTDASMPPKVKSEMVVLKPMQLQNGDVVKNNNLALLSTRQSIAMQYQRDMLKAQEEVRVPREVSYPARNVEVVDTCTQTNLFSLLESGRLVEMTLSAEPKDAKVGMNTMRLTNSNSVPKPSSGSATFTPGKRLVSLDSSGRVLMFSGSSSSTEPVTKKLKLDQSDQSIFKLLCSTSNQSNLTNNENQNLHKQTMKNLNELMVCENIIDQNNDDFDMDTTESEGNSNFSKLELNGVEAMVVNPSDILPDNLKLNKPKDPLVKKRMILQTAFKDWTNCLIPDKDGNVPIHNAVLDEDLTQVKRQCFVLAGRKESVNILNAEKQTPLHLAVWRGCTDIVETLLKFGSRPDLMDMQGNNALHLATERTSNLECLEIILENYNCKTFINSLNHDGHSPLHLCALRSSCEQAVALIKKGADINLRDGKSGRTALFHSVEARDSKLSRLLVQYGASASVTNFAGQTPLLATNDMSMLGERAMASVIMSRTSLMRTRERAGGASAIALGQSWKGYENQDR